MKKIYRRLSALFMCVVVFVSFTAPCFAVSSVSDDASSVQIIERRSKFLQRDEVLSILMDKCGSSYNEAVQQYNAVMARGVERLEERYVTVDVGGGYEIEVGCLVEVQCMSRCNYGEIITSWSAATGSNVHDWDDFYIHVTVEGRGADNIRFRTRGNLIVIAESSTTVGLEAAGFSLSSTAGSTMYYRKAISIDELYK